MTKQLTMIKKIIRSLTQVRTIYIITTIFLVALSLYSFILIKKLFDASEWVDHTHKVALSLEKIRTAVVNAETSQKNFMLTGDSSQLIKRENYLYMLNTGLNLADSLTSDNPEQAENLKMLRAAIAERLLTMKKIIAAATPLELSDEFSLNLSEGIRQTEIVNEQINRISQTETQFLEIRKQKFNVLAIITTLFIILLFIGAYLILWISYRRINRELQLSQKLKTTVEESNIELEKRNEELRRSGEQFLEIFDNNPVAMTFAEIGNNQIVYANCLFYNLFGYTKEELIDHTSEEMNLVSQKENERLLPIIMSYLQEERSVEGLKALPEEDRVNILLTLKEKMFKNGFEVEYTRKNGETFFAVVFFEVIHIGNKKYTLTTYLDVTERRKVEKQLAEQKAFAESVIEYDPALILAYDENLSVIAWNKKAEQITGIKKSDVMGKHPFDVFPEYNNAQWASAFEAVLKEGQTIHYPQVAFKRTNGYGEFWLMPLKNASQQIIGILSITSDITKATEITMALEQKNMELEKINRELLETAATLEISEERYNRMITEVKDYAILFLSKEGIIENWNQGAEKIKCYKADEVIGRNFSLFYTEQDRQSQLPKKLLAEAEQNGTSVHEGWRVRKDGSKFWGSTVLTALHDNSNNIIGFSKVTRDLTEKKMANDKILTTNSELEQKNKELKKLNKELESINYISSHDLQEPLRQIQIFASRIIDVEQNLSDKGKVYFERMNNAAKRMQNLISDLLSYSRTQTGVRNWRTINLNQVVNEVAEDFAEIIDGNHSIIEAGELGSVHVIPFQFRQMIYNLIGNSLKFTKPGTPSKIIIRNEIVRASQVPGDDAAMETDYYHISIADNGIGFEPQYKDKIFEVFQRLHDKQKVAGTGIGLAIVKNIVANHNGFITATGEPDKGATFHIYIPTIQTLNR